MQTTRPLRFCMATTFYPPWNFGGDGIQVQRLARALTARGHEVTVVHSVEGYRALGGAEQPPADRDGDVRLVAVDAGRLSPVATYLTGRPLLAGPQLAAALAGPFDVLHFHNPSLLGGPGALSFGRGLKLYTAHEQWLLCPMHVLWQDGERVCETPHCVRCSLHHRRPPQPWRSGSLLRRSLRHLDAVIAPSETSAKMHAALAGGVHVEHLPHFVEDPGFRPASPRQGRPYVLFAGRLEPIKGAATLLEAFRRYDGVDLVIAGTGSQEPRLRELARDLGHVRFAGHVAPEELDELYRGAVAVVVPSVGHEAFGLVAVEALARGTRAIVRKFGALAEFARLGEGVDTYRTTDELVSILARLAAETPGSATRARAAARRAYLDHYTPEPHLARYLTLISQLAEARGDAALCGAAAAHAGAAALPAAA